MKSLYAVSSGLALLTLVACSSSDKQTATPTVVENPQTHTPVGVTGVKIDPAAKTVVVVSPATVLATPEQRIAQLETQRDKGEAQLGKMMKGYSNALNDPKAKEKTAEQMKKEMELYKRQTLELVELKRQAAATGTAANDPR